MMTKNLSLEKAKKSLRFDLQRSIRYNSKRRAFFEFWDKATNFLTLLTGSSTVVALLADVEQLQLISSITVAVLSVLSLSIGFGQRATERAEFANQFTVLVNQLEQLPLTQALIDRVKAEMNTLDAKEPAPLIVLEQICYNEQLRVEGFPAERMTPIGWYQRLFAHYFSICPERMFEKLNSQP